MGSFLTHSSRLGARLCSLLLVKRVKCESDEVAGEAKVPFNCLFCKDSFATRNSLFKHLRREHPTCHNRTCQKCNIFPVTGSCYECKEAVLCSKCFEKWKEHPQYASLSFNNNLPQHMQGGHQVKKAPKAEVAEVVEESEKEVGPAKAPLQLTSKLPKSVVDAFNQRASCKRPSFRIPSKILLEEVPLEDLEFARRNGLLHAVPIGTTSTFGHEEKDQWLNLAKLDKTRDIALSPAEPQVTSELLKAILRFHTFATKLTCQDLRRVAKSTWNCRDSAEAWQSCAEKTPGIRIHRERSGRGSSGHRSASIQLQQGECVEPFDFEEFALQFLAQVDGREFYSTPSLAESMHFYGPFDVPLDLCYHLVWLARQSGCIVPVADGRSDGALMVKLTKDSTREVRVVGQKNSKSWGVVDDMMEFGNSYIQKLSASEVLPTKGMREAVHCQQKYGGSFARELCPYHERSHCNYGEDCKFIHKVSPGVQGDQKLCESLSEKNCRVQAADLRDIFWEAMKEGDSRLSLQTFLERSTKNDCMDVLQRLQREVDDGNVNVLVVATSGHLARHWNAAESINLNQVLSEPKVRLFLSPVLTKPPARLLECLDRSFRKELLAMKVSYLRWQCKSCFALTIPRQGWSDLAKKGGYSLKRIQTGEEFLTKPRETRRIEWQPTTDTTERKADLRSFMGDLEDWPSPGILLESARLFGPTSLQPSPPRRSRLAALLCVLREITGDSDEAQVFEADEDEAVVEESDGGHTKMSNTEMFQEMEWLFPAPYVPENVWPAPRTPLQMVELLSKRCDPRKAASTVVKGKRVLNHTRPYARVCTMLNKLTYDESINTLVDGSYVTQASTARALLKAAGYDEKVLEDWLGDENEIFFDLLVAMIMAKWRRFNEGRTCGKAPDAQEILGGLLLAKALSHGQGRSHRLRRPIVGLLWRHERLRGKLPLTSRGGSVGMGMDTSSSDHDIFVQIKDGDVDMVQLLHDVILDLQQKDTHYRLKRSKIVRKDFAIEIQGYYRARDFDIVPYTIRPDEGECQWDAERGVWQPILHKKLTPKLQELSEDQPDAFLMTRLLKIWNESLPTLRKSDTNDKVPLISLHIPLMVLAARDHGVLDVCQNPQGFFLKSLKFLQENWWRSDLACQTLEGIEAEAHLQRMCKKYRDTAMHEELSQLLDDHVKILEALCQQQGNDKRTADLIVSQLRSMFGGELLTPRPAYKAPLDAN